MPTATIVEPDPSLLRIQRQHRLRAAQGYLELAMPEQALGELGPLRSQMDGDGHASYLYGEALRKSHLYYQAIDHLQMALAVLPHQIAIYMSLAWCYKRTEQLPLAIEALERALGVDPGQAILHYNLACYWSLARRPRISLQYLKRAVELDDQFRELALCEPDFKPIRRHPRFVAMTSLIA